MKIFYIFIILFLFSGIIIAQQLSNNNLYSQNLFLINPAATGQALETMAFIKHETRFSGLKGAPTTDIFGIHGEFSENSSLGLMVSNYNSGLIDTWSGNLSYAHNVQLFSDQLLKLGVSGGFSKTNILEESAVVNDPNDPVLQPDYYNSKIFQAGAGILYERKDFIAGVSIPQIYFDANRKSYYKDNFQVFGAYSYILKDSSFTIRPSVLYRNTRNLKDQFDINVLVDWKNKCWTEISYKTSGNISIAAGLNYNQLGIAYSYEYTRKELSDISNGCHEIMLMYRFKKAYEK